ncbi:anti-sigma factor [Nocardia sp. NBC_01730]|uniref:anti-sigma factor n=1 Tax=Nocardia sp. NBC_01730 TaxID=2975998 RepID=UPI002E0FB956|nr:anti-sigma factor [Nocardia sp. NBC_01730]
MTETGQPQADLLDLAYPYALDAVAEIERRSIENRVATADSVTAIAFAATVHRVRETLTALSVPAAVNPPPTLESKVLQALDQSTGRARPEQRGKAVVGRVPRLARLAVAAAVVAVVGAGAVVIAERTIGDHAVRFTAEQILVQPDSRSHVAQLPGGGTLTVSTSARLGAVAVRFEAVPAPPSGQAYQLWLVTSGVPRSAAVLTTVPQAGVLTRFDPADILALTIEPASGSAHPTSPPLAAVALG